MLIHLLCEHLHNQVFFIINILLNIAIHYLLDHNKMIILGLHYLFTMHKNRYCFLQVPFLIMYDFLLFIDLSTFHILNLYNDSYRVLLQKDFVHYQLGSKLRQHKLDHLQ